MCYETVIILNFFANVWLESFSNLLFAIFKVYLIVNSTTQQFPRIVKYRKDSINKSSYLYYL